MVEPSPTRCRRLLPRFGVRRTVAIAGLCTLVAGTSMGVMALAGVKNIWAIMLPFYLFMVGHGVHQPCGQSGAVGPFPRAAGAASALSGFLMMVAAFGMGGWLGKSLAGIAAGSGSVLPLTNGIWFWSVLIAATALQRAGSPDDVADAVLAVAGAGTLGHNVYNVSTGRRFTLLDWGRRVFGTTINEFYGQTECNMVVSSCSAPEPPRPGMMGRAVPGHAVEIVDPQTGAVQTDFFGHML